MAKIKRNKLEEADYDAVAVIGSRHKAAPIQFFQAAGMTVQDIQAIAISNRLDIVYIDYLQLITGRGSRNRVDEVSGISMDLHRMAQSNGITVVALSQLSRPEKSGESSRAPTMSALRESGQIEQDADVVMLLYKTEPEKANSPRELKIAKNKEGTTGKQELIFDGQTQTFRSAGYQSRAKAAVPEQPPKQYQFYDLTTQEKADLPF
ncbi:Replicative DNA helicase [bioreactor metagenome]|uniref:Replicative DNA helicase n=1 Tax=bioreactor metagenome TaxID=1076179 RepID=A0A645FCB4_9ZZZZ